MRGEQQHRHIYMHRPFLAAASMYIFKYCAVWSWVFSETCATALEPDQQQQRSSLDGALARMPSTNFKLRQHYLRAVLEPYASKIEKYSQVLPRIEIFLKSLVSYPISLAASGRVTYSSTASIYYLATNCKKLSYSVHSIWYLILSKKYAAYMLNLCMPCSGWLVK